MAVYYKFKSAKDFYSLPISGRFISVSQLKFKIIESKQYGKGNDFNLTISNAQTEEEYLDDSAVIPDGTSVLIRRIPRRLGKPIVFKPDEQADIIGTEVEDTLLQSNNAPEHEWHDFGDDPFIIPGVGSARMSNRMQGDTNFDKDEEERKIKDLVEKPAVGWQCQTQNSYDPQRGFGRGMSGRGMAGRGLGWGGLPRKPPEGYVCHRCNLPGHFIQHCPTNGDPDFDIKQMRAPTGIPKSKLMVNSDGSYVLRNGDAAILKPNEAAFEKEMEGVSSTHSFSDIPLELHCPLCKDVMKEAMLTSKCCFNSFCDKCIRGYVISEGKCICGAMNIRADDLIPNKTLRGTINSILESSSSSSGKTGSLVHFNDMKFAHKLQLKVTSSNLSAASNDEHKQPLTEGCSNLKEVKGASEGKADNVAIESLEKNDTEKVDFSESKPALKNVENSEERMSRGNAEVLEVIQEKRPGCGEQGKKKKKKRMNLPGNAADMQWGYSGLPLVPPAYNAYMAGCVMPWGIDGYVGQHMPYMRYAPGYFDGSYGGTPQDPFGMQTHMLPILPRDLSELCSSENKNQGAPIAIMEELKAKKFNLRRECENKDGFNGREMENRKVSICAGNFSKKSDHKLVLYAAAEQLDQSDGWPTKSMSHKHHGPQSLTSRPGSQDVKASNKRQYLEKPVEYEHSLKRSRACVEGSSSEERHFKRRPSWSDDLDHEQEHGRHARSSMGHEHEPRRGRDQGRGWSSVECK